jgi:hypothetical protein
MAINITGPVNFRGNIGVNSSFLPNYPLQVGDSYAGGRVLKLLQPGETFSYFPFNSQFSFQNFGAFAPTRVFITYEVGKPHGIVWAYSPNGADTFIYGELQTMNARLTATWSHEESAPLPAQGHITKLPLYIGNSASEWFVHNREERILAANLGWFSPSFLNTIERVDNGQCLNSCRSFGNDCSFGNTNTLAWSGRVGYVRYF